MEVNFFVVNKSHYKRAVYIGNEPNRQIITDNVVPSPCQSILDNDDTYSIYV